MMKELSMIQTQEVSGGGIFLELATTFAGAAIGCATAAVALPAANVAWLGLVPVSIPLAGAFIGGSLGHILYNVEEITTDIATVTHSTIYSYE